MAGRTSAIIEKLSSIIATVEYRARSLVTAESPARIVLAEALQVGKTSIDYLAGKFVEIYFRYFGDSATIEDSSSIGTGKNTFDNLVLDETLDKSFDKVSDNTTNTSDLLERTVVYSRGFSDLTDITDSVSSLVSKPLDESLSFTDQTSIVNVYNRSLLDTVLATDDVNGAGADDDQNITFFKNTGDFTQVFDTLGFESSYNRQFSDDGSVGDLGSIEAGKFFYDAGELSDSLTITSVFNRSPEDVSQVLDIKYVEVAKAAEDNTAITDSLASVISYFRSIDDSATATDDVNGAAADDDQNITFFKNTGELTNLIDLVEFVSVFNRAFEDATNLTDSTEISSTKLLEDSTGLTDNSSIEAVKGLFDNSLVEDDFTRTFLSSRAFEDYSSILDSLNYEFSKDISDSGSILDSINFATSYSRTLSDVSNITDTNTLEISKNSVDSLQILDALSFENTYLRSVSDESSITDNATTALFKNLDDYINLQDAISQLIDYGLVSGDLLNVTDDVNGAGVDDDQTITFFKNLPSELLNITITVSKGPEKGVEEALSITSQGVLLNQNYGADYFAQDYVGVSRSFT